MTRAESKAKLGIAHASTTLTSPGQVQRLHRYRRHDCQARVAVGSLQRYVEEPPSAARFSPSDLPASSKPDSMESLDDARCYEGTNCSTTIIVPARTNSLYSDTAC